MYSHFITARSATLLIGLLCFMTLSGAAMAAQNQQGLPVELVIDDSAPLKDQLNNMQALYATASEQLPKGGILSGLRGMFGSSEEQPIYASVSFLSLHPDRLRGALVEAEGIWEPNDTGGVLRSAGYAVNVEFAGGTEPEGFEAVGGPEGMPVLVTGRVETLDDGEALLRADAVSPSALLAAARIGRIMELQDEWESAAGAYEEIGSIGALSTRPMAAFARIRAGFIALKYLGDEKRSRTQLSQAWELYTRRGTEQLGYWTWIPDPDGAWDAMLVRDAIEEPLDELNSHLMGYRIVDLFVRIAGGSPALGVILLAIVLRVAIHPLTKKQLVSQKRMQAIQPQIKELQKEHATDKQKFQEEFWALCKEHNCNPLGGCLPMLVQMPILIFLYRGIREYIVRFEGISFLWVENLASPDIVLLILYTLSMIAFQKLAAKSQPTADPQQQQQQQMMAYMMPVMFFFFFQSFPAAFILYWLGSNVVYFGEQALYMRGGPAEEPVKQAAPQKQSGFVNSMLGAAKRMGGAEEVKEEEAGLSYTERRKQEKSKRRGKKGR